VNEALHLLNELAALIHGGSLLAFALLLNGRRAIPHVRTVDVVRVYRAFGAGIGLSLGAFVPTDLYRHVHALNPELSLPSSLALRFDAPDSTLLSVRMLLLFALWVSYISLEVWSIEPTRKLDQNGIVLNEVAYEAAAGRVARHLALNAALFAGVVLCGAMSRSWP
jgi:hypothetical protein